jgi:tetratricopeptide (TPR) repeat protein
MKYFIKSILFFSVTIMIWQANLPAQQATLQEEQDYRFAVELENKGLNDIAALQFERLANIYPFSMRAPEALMRAGQNYERADSLVKASQLYLSLLLKYPQSPLIDQAQFARAKLLAKNGEHVQAALAFDRIKVLTAQSTLVPDAQVEAAREFLQAQDYQHAADAAFYVLEKFPTHPLRLKAHYLMAQIHEAKQENMDALENLDRILSEKIEDEFAARVYTDKARLLNKIGRFAQADSVLQKLIKGNYGGPIVGAAAVQLAESLLSTRNFTASARLFSDVLPKVDEKSRAALLLLQADSDLMQNEWALAKAALAQIKPEQLASSQAGYYYRLALVERSLLNPRDALTFYQKALTDTLADPQMIHYVKIDYARMLAAAGQPLDAVRLLQEYLRDLTVSTFRNQVFYKIAAIMERYLRDYDGARQNYQAIIAGAARCALVDDAQYYIALTFVKQSQPENALDAFNRYLTYYPGGDYDQQCRRQAELYRLLTFDQSGGPSQAPAALSSAEMIYRLALLDLYSRHQYNRVYVSLQQALKEDSNHRLNKAELMHLMAACLYAQIDADAQAELSPGRQTDLDKLHNLAQQMLAEFPDSPFAHKVNGWDVQLRLDVLSKNEDKQQAIEEELQRLPIGSDDDLRHNLTLELVDVLTIADSTHHAGQLLDGLLAEQIPDAVKAQALLKYAHLLLRQSLPDSAAPLLATLYGLHDPVTQIEGSYLLAFLNEKNNPFEAQRLYAEIIDRYYYSPFAERAQIQLISLLLKQGQYRQAEQLIQQRQAEGVPKELHLLFPPTGDQESVWLWAELHRRTSPAQQALPFYYDYLELGRDTPHRAEALFAVAELSEKMNNQETALGYYAEIAEAFPQDTLSQRALLKTAELYFERGIYDKARDQYVIIAKRLDGSFRQDALEQQIICEYRLGNTGRAADLEKDFKKAYDDRNAEARFLYEAGLLSMAKKDFDAAEKAFKNLSGKYDDVPEGARGDLGLAQLYVIQTKTEDALKRLTSIPEKYKDPEIVATAFVNLADFYYKNRQIENSIAAATRVLDLRENGPLRAQALDLLIDAYDDINLRDKAIALQREYIELYPYDPDLMNRRIRIGVFLYGLKEYDRAISQLKELRPLVPAEAEAEVQYWIARSYADAGMTEEGIIEYLKVRYQCKPTKLPWGATALYEAGQGYRKLGNLAKAREMYDLVVRERGATDNIGRAANTKIQEIDAELKKAL